jgi:hypothetical protein
MTCKFAHVYEEYGDIGQEMAEEIQDFAGGSLHKS